jgi:hypothetical protein
LGFFYPLLVLKKYLCKSFYKNISIYIIQINEYGFLFISKYYIYTNRISSIGYQ